MIKEAKSKIELLNKSYCWAIVHQEKDYVGEEATFVLKSKFNQVHITYYPNSPLVEDFLSPFVLLLMVRRFEQISWFELIL